MSGGSGPARFVAVVVLLAVLGVGVRLAFLATASKPLPNPGDAMAYHLLAEGLAEGDGYVRPFDRLEGRNLPTAEWGPAFPAVLALADLAGVDDLEQQRRAAACLAALGIVLTGLAGRIIGGAPTGTVAAAIVAFHPLVVQHDTALLTEVLALAAGAAIVLASARLARSGRAREAVIAGVAVGVAALVRADALALVVVLLVPLCFVVGARWRGGLRLAAIALGGVALVVAPWVVRNVVRLDAFVGVSTNAATAVAGANCDVTYDGDVVGYWRFGPGCFLGYDTGELVERGEADVAADHLGDGFAYARAHAGRVPAVVGARLLRLWGVWDVDEQASLAALDEGKSASWIRVGTWVGWVVTALAAVGLVLLVRSRAAARLVVLGGPLVAVTVAAAVTYGNARFRAGAEPALAVLAAAAVTRRWPGP